MPIPYTEADHAYVTKNFVPLDALCSYRGDNLATVREHIAEGRLPQPTYVLPDGREMVPATYFALADEAGGIEFLRDDFFRRCPIAASGEDVELDPAEEWDAYLSGEYGVCLAEVSPESIAPQGLAHESDRAGARSARGDRRRLVVGPTRRCRRIGRTRAPVRAALRPPALWWPVLPRPSHHGDARPLSGRIRVEHNRGRLTTRNATLRHMAGAYLLNLGVVPYREALEVQRSLAGAVSQRAIPETIVLLEHPPVVTLGRRTDEAGELHLPEDAGVDVVETNRGGKSTFHGPGQLVCYPILDLNRHGRDVKQYVRDLEEALIRTLAAFDIAGARIDGLTGVWLESPQRKIASIGVHVSRWVTTHGYALNVDLDPAPFTDWITACGLEDASFTTMSRELGRPIAVDNVRPAAAASLGDVFGLELEELPAEEGHGLWAQPVHAQLAGRR